MSSKTHGIIGIILLLLATVMSVLLAIDTGGLAVLRFSMHMSIDRLLGQFIPIMTGLAALALLVALGLFAFGKRYTAGRVSSLGFLLLLPVGLFVGVLGIIKGPQAFEMFGLTIGEQISLGQLILALLMATPGVAIATTILAALAAYFVTNSVVRESEETFDRKPTRGMNIMDPDVQKELEEARKKHQDKQNQ
ncbi:MAG: hypothetical protein ACQEVA_10250, partial [Myxococcota bacterium]